MTLPALAIPSAPDKVLPSMCRRVGEPCMTLERISHIHDASNAVRRFIGAGFGR